MLPAGEHLEADDLAGFQVDLRLEIGNELLVLEAVAQALLDFAERNQSALHAGVEPQGPGDPAVAGMVEGDVGAAQQIGDGDLGRRRRGDAEVGADLQHLAADLERAGHGLQESFPERLGDLRAVLRDDEGERELVAVEARGDRFLADLGGNDAGDGAQHIVADLIAVAVVDRLEAVHPQRNDGQPVAAAGGEVAQLLAAVGEALAVGKAGDGVADGHVRRPFLALQPPFGFVQQIGVAPPAEEDQGDVQRQGNAGHLDLGTELVGGAAHRRPEQIAAVEDQQGDGADEDRQHDDVAPDPAQRKGLLLAKSGRNGRRTTHETPVITR